MNEVDVEAIREGHEPHRVCFGFLGGEGHERCADCEDRCRCGASFPCEMTAVLDRLEAAEQENEKHRADLKEWEEHGAPAWIDAKQELIDEQRARAEAAEAKIAAIRAQHRVDKYTEGRATRYCICEEEWPCSTFQTLQESEGK